MSIAWAARKAAGYLALTLAAFSLAGAATARQANWHAQQVVAAADGTSRILWTADTVNGTVAGIWKMDASGNKIGSGPVYGPYTSDYGHWSPQQLSVAQNGTCRLLWTATNSNGSLGVVWTLDSNGNETSYGTIYGPYSDVNGSWYPRELEMANDGTSRLLWVNTNDNNTGVEAGVWVLNSTGQETAEGGVYGPYYDTNGANWEPYQLVVAPDGTSRLLWVVYGSNDDYSGNYQGDTITIYKLDTNGNKINQGQIYGPFKGWGVANFDMNASDQTLRMLWENFGTYDDNDNYSGDEAGVWSFDTNGNETTIGQVYGPFTGWYADAIAALPDGTSRVEWHNANSGYDEVGLWGFDSHDNQLFIGPTYGPFNGWTLEGADIDRSDNSFRLLWTRDDKAAGLWSLNSNGKQTAVGTIYGPFTFTY